MHNVMKIMSNIIPSVHRHCRLLCVVAILSVLGCGHSDRVSVEGTVTLDGKSLEKGQIQFTPQPGTAGPTAGASIVDGKFTIPADGGPFTGKFRVEITQSGPTGRKILDARSNKMIDEYSQLLPAQYNTKSKLEAEVTSSGPNKFEFALTSK